MDSYLEIYQMDSTNIQFIKKMFSSKLPSLHKAMEDNQMW